MADVKWVACKPIWQVSYLLDERPQAKRSEAK